MCLKQTNWFCFLPLMCVRAFVRTCTNCLQCTRMRRRRASCALTNTIRKKHASAHTHSHNQTTSTQLWHPSCRLKGEGILKLSLSCSLVFDSNPADTCLWQFDIWNHFLGKKKKSKAGMRRRRRRRGGVRGGEWGVKHQEVHEGECEISMLIYCCPALNITKR